MIHSETPTSIPAQLTLSDAIHAIGQLQGALDQIFEMGLRSRKEPLIRSLDTISQYLFLLAARQNQFFIKHQGKSLQEENKNEDLQNLIKWFCDHELKVENLLKQAKKIIDQYCGHASIASGRLFSINWQA